MKTLHISKVLTYLMKQDSIFAENCSKNFLFDFDKKFVSNRGNLPIFHEAGNLLGTFTCSVRTSMALVPSQHIKMCWKLQ